MPNQWIRESTLSRIDSGIDFYCSTDFIIRQSSFSCNTGWKPWCVGSRAHERWCLVWSFFPPHLLDPEGVLHTDLITTLTHLLSWIFPAWNEAKWFISSVYYYIQLYTERAILCNLVSKRAEKALWMERTFICLIISAVTNRSHQANSPVIFH